MLWFHPAIWWLIGRVQLTREQVVDQEAVRLLERVCRVMLRQLATFVAIGIAVSLPFLLYVGLNGGVVH